MVAEVERVEAELLGEPAGGEHALRRRRVVGATSASANTAARATSAHTTSPATNRASSRKPPVKKPSAVGAAIKAAAATARTAGVIGAAGYLRPISPAAGGRARP